MRRPWNLLWLGLLSLVFLAAWGAHALRAALPEWALLGGRPEPWRAQDAVLVLAVMFDDLTWDEADEEAKTERMDATLPPAVVAFLRPAATPLDVPLDGASAPPVPPTPD